MERFTNNIADKIGLELGLDDERKEVIAYGTFALVHTLISIICVIIFGMIFNVLMESLIVAFSISILRKYSGGAHANSPEVCAVIGTIIAIGESLFICSIKNTINLKIYLPIVFIIFIWCLYIVCKLAPVDSEAKPIKTQTKRTRMKKGSIFVLGLYILAVIVNVIMYNKTSTNMYLVISMCICAGALWQVITLTYIGHLIMDKMDTFLNQIFTFLLRRN